MNRMDERSGIGEESRNECEGEKDEYEIERRIKRWKMDGKSDKWGGKGHEQKLRVKIM